MLIYQQLKLKEIYGIKVALKEAGETDYWLEILYSAEYLTEMEYKSLKNDNDELIKMLSSIIKTTKENTPKFPKNS